MRIRCRAKHQFEAIEARTDYGPLARVEERASILLLQSLPADLQTEAVSVRGLASSALIFLLMSRYQPGGSSEKSMILSFLTQPHVDGQSNVLSHHAALRKLDRLYRRGKELGLQSPDRFFWFEGWTRWGRSSITSRPEQRSPCQPSGISTSLILLLRKPLFCSIASC